MGFQKCIGPEMFSWIRHYGAEVCAPPSALLVISIITPPKVEGGYVFTPVCLFVCLCAGYLKKLWTDSDEIWWAGLVCDKDELIRFFVKIRIQIRRLEFLN